MFETVFFCFFVLLLKEYKWLTARSSNFSGIGKFASLGEFNLKKPLWRRGV